MTDAEKLRRIMADPIKWIETFVRIVNKESKLVPFKLNPQQRYIMTHKDKFNIVLKSRQLGITSVALAYSLYLAITKPYSNCMIMSYSDDSTRAIFAKLKQMYDDLPDCVRMETLSYNRSEITFINHSRIIVCICGSKDHARGATLNFAHLSEVGLMNENLDTQLIAIEQAIVSDGCMFLESTAKGLNKFSELWFKAVSKEAPMWKPFFFSWVDDKLMYSKEYKEYQNRYKSIYGELLTKENLDEQELILFEKGASLSQLMWRRLKISNNSLDYFHQEFPSTPTEAFISSGSNVFNPGMIQERLGNINKMPLFELTTKANETLRKYKKYLKIWKNPAKNEKYYIGVDIGEGLGGSHDYSVITVIDKDGFQCAEWRSNRVKPYEISAIVTSIGKYYNNGLLVIEKASAGHTVLDRVFHDHHYINLYKYKAYDQKGKIKRQIGYYTDTKSRPIMIADLQEWFETGKILVNSKDLLNEMKLFQSVNDKMQAAAGGHDDAVMAMAMAIQGLKSQQYYYQIGK